MKKKVLINISILLAAILVTGYIILPEVGLYLITDYSPYTFEKILTNSKLKARYGIFNNTKPENYGYKSEEINFKSLDGIKLNGWYVEAKKPTNHSILLVHGRTTNRLKTMKYLALVDSLQLDTLYNVFIPDMRNSGKSQSTKTYMGYKFAEDVVASLLLLHNEYKQDSVLIYAFSMGAMATLNATGRKRLTDIYKDKIFVEKLILDSPLVNVRETLKDQASEIPLVSLTFNRTFEYYSEEINNFGNEMRISKLLDPTISTLILQSTDDELTKFFIFQKELAQVSLQDSVDIVYFEGPGHVRIFQDDRVRANYIKAVSNFVYPIN